MESYKDQWAAATKAAREILDSAPDGELTEDQQKDADDLLTKAADFQAKHEKQEKSAAQRKALAGLEDDEPTPKADDEQKSATERFVKSVGEAASRGGKFSVGSPELKAATDPFLTADSGGLETTYGPVLETKYRRLRLVDLLSSGTLNNSTFTYWQQGTLEGDFTTVAEGAAKPSLSFNFGQVVEVLRKIAGVTKVSDETTQDAAAMISVIRSQLLQRLAIVEEDQLLNGNGTAPNISGILDRSGVQTDATSATLTAKKALDGILHAITLVETNSFIPADGIVINPEDYELVRLGVDGNEQYYGGGPFTGAYGNDGFSLQPGLWTLPTVVTPAIAQGTVLVGAFRTGAQVFRKGGVRLESTNSNEDDFKKNLIAIRAEERLALAVYYPPAFVNLTLTA